MTLFDPKELPELRQTIRAATIRDRRLLDNLRKEVRALAPEVRAIQPRTTTSVSLVASDGGNNKLGFDPFHVQLVRVVDSDGEQLCLDAVTPTTDTDALSRAQFNNDGTPRTALGRVMIDVGVDSRTLAGLSHMIPDGRAIRETPDEVSPSWVLVYRDLCEWAALYERICYRSFATNPLLVRDGLLRSKLFRGDYFITFRKRIEDAIDRIRQQTRRKVFLVGVAKHSKALGRYDLAMALEGTFTAGPRRPGRSRDGGVPARARACPGPSLDACAVRPRAARPGPDRCGADNGGARGCAPAAPAGRPPDSWPATCSRFSG